LKVLHLHIYSTPIIRATKYVVLYVCERNLETDIQVSRKDVEVWQLHTVKDFFLNLQVN